MANPLGTFDKDLVAVAWFDVTQQPAGWFSSGCVTTESVAPAGVTASVALVESGDSLAASGSVNLAATTALTESGDTASGQGAVAVSASATLTQGADTASSTAAVAVSASTALNESGDTLTATSAVAVTGSTTLNEGADTSTATGAVVISVTGVLAEGADTTASAGTVTVSGAVALGESVDTISATGTVVSGVTATAALLEVEDTLLASATVASGVVGVDADITLVEADDTLSSAATVTSIPVGTSEYPFFSAGFFSAGFFSAGFWGVASQPYVDLTHAERVYVRTLLHKAYVEASVAQIVIHAEKFNVSVLEAIEQLRVKLKLKQDRVLTIFDEVTYMSKLTEVRNEGHDNATYVLLKNELFAVRTLRNEEVALFSKEQSLSAKTVFCEELTINKGESSWQ